MFFTGLPGGVKLGTGSCLHGSDYIGISSSILVTIFLTVVYEFG